MDMLQTIERIPAQLKKIAANNSRLNGLLQEKLKADSKFKKVLIVASGTSYNAAFTTKNFAENKLGYPVEVVYPNIFLNYSNQDLLNEDTLYIFISQGGKTKLVFEALNLVKSKGYQTLSLTESLDTPIAKRADIAVEIGSEHEEFMFRTLGYSSTCATLYWLYILLGKRNGKVSEDQATSYLIDYSRMIGNLEPVKERTLEWYEKNKEALLQRTKFLFSGTNDLWPVAQEADIKFMEMLPVFTNSFELEELIHGPQNAFDDSIGYFILSRSGEDNEKAANISAFINEEISVCYVIGDKEEADFDIKPKSEYFSSLEYMTFFQVLAYLLATEKGRDLTKTMYPQLTNYINKSL